jgi:hypothetical protein
MWEREGAWEKCRPSWDAFGGGGEIMSLCSNCFLTKLQHVT